MSSSEQAKDNVDFRKRPRRVFSPEQKQATIDAFEQAKSADPHLRVDQWAAAQGIHASMLARWRKERGKKKTRTKTKKSDAPDHVRDINALAVLNSPPPQRPESAYAPPPPLPATGDHTLDERLGMVLGATIAEIMRRLRT